jgi:hypothetical protein
MTTVADIHGFRVNWGCHTTGMSLLGLIASNRSN